MNRKQLLSLLLVLAVTGGVALLLYKKQAETLHTGVGDDSGKLLQDLPVGEQLAVFTIRQGTNVLTLAKHDGVWCVEQRGDYPADYSRISRTVLKVRDLKPVQTEQVAPAQLGRLELLEPGTTKGAGTLVEFRDSGDQLLGALRLGKQQTRKDTGPSEFGAGSEPREIPVGRWVMDPRAETTVALVSDPLASIEPDPAAWLNKDFFKVQKIKSIQVAYPNAPTNSFQLSRSSESGPWTLAGLKDQEELDATKTSGFNYALNNPTFNDVIVDPDAARLGLERPVLVRIETFEGFDYEIKVGTKSDSTLPLRVAVQATYPREREASEDEDASVKTQKDKEFADTLKTRDDKLAKEQALEKWTYRVSSWSFDSVLKKRGDLVKEKEPEEPQPGTTEAPADPVESLLNLPPANP